MAKIDPSKYYYTFNACIHIVLRQNKDLKELHQLL